LSGEKENKIKTPSITAINRRSVKQRYIKCTNIVTSFWVAYIFLKLDKAVVLI
jgi:hypothetical protein